MRPRRCGGPARGRRRTRGRRARTAGNTACGGAAGGPVTRTGFSRPRTGAERRSAPGRGVRAPAPSARAGRRCWERGRTTRRGRAHGTGEAHQHERAEPHEVVHHRSGPADAEGHDRCAPRRARVGGAVPVEGDRPRHGPACRSLELHDHVGPAGPAWPGLGGPRKSRPRPSRPRTSLGAARGPTSRAIAGRARWTGWAIAISRGRRAHKKGRGPAITRGDLVHAARELMRRRADLRSATRRDAGPTGNPLNIKKFKIMSRGLVRIETEPNRCQDAQSGERVHRPGPRVPVGPDRPRLHDREDVLDTTGRSP